MIHVKTRFFAFLRERTGRSEDVIELEDNATIETFLKKLAEKYEKELMGYVFVEEGALRSGFAVALNGENVKPESFAEIKLRDGDTVVILPPIAGGLLE